MKKKLLSLVQYLFFLALGLFLLWLTLRKSDWNTIIEDLSEANYIYLIPAIIFLLFSHFIRALRWKILMQPLGYNPGTTNTFLAVLIGYWANLAVPRLGEVLKCTALARYEKLPADKLVGTIVAERAIDVVCLLLLLLLTVALQYDIIGAFTIRTLSGFFTRTTGELSVLKLAGILLLLILISIGLIIFFRRSQNKLAGKLKKLIAGVWQGLVSIRYIRRKWTFFLHSALIWFFYLLSTYMGFFAMQGLAQYGLGGALSALSFGSLGMIIPSPGGIGSFQYATQQVMMLYGVSAEKGLSLGMLIWLAQTGVIIVVGTISFFILPIINRRKHEISSNH